MSEKYLSRKQMKARLDQMCDLVLKLMPSVTLCPTCQEIDLNQLMLGIQTTDAFVIPYGCLHCTAIHVLVIDLQDASITMQTPNIEQLDIIRESIEGVNDLRPLYDVVVDQIRHLKAQSN